MNLPVLRKFPIIPILLLGGSFLLPGLALGQANQATLNLTDKLTLNSTSAGSNAVEVRSNGSLYSLTSYSDYTPVWDVALGTAGSMAFLWDSGRGSLRAGHFSGSQLQWYNILPGTVAFGRGTQATGWFSLAAGYFSSAPGTASVAFGQAALAAGPLSFATGDNVSAGGQAAFAAGTLANASGLVSTAFGFDTRAVGDLSFAAGISTRADAYGSFAVGRYNLGSNLLVSSGTAGQVNWIPSDPVFEIGIGDWPVGSAQPVRRNALTVYKDGRVEIPKRQRDILMGEFGNPGD